MGRVPGHLAGFLTCVMSGKAHRDTGLVMPEGWVGMAGGWWLVARDEGERGADSPNSKFSCQLVHYHALHVGHVERKDSGRLSLFWTCIRHCGAHRGREELLPWY